MLWMLIVIDESVLQALHKKDVAASRESATTLRTLLNETTVKDSDKEEVQTHAGAPSVSLDSCDILCQAMERVFRCGLKPGRYKVSFFKVQKTLIAMVQGVDSAAKANKTADADLELSSYHADSPMGSPSYDKDQFSGLDALDASERVPFWLREDAETIYGGQKDLFMNGDSDLGDVDMLVSDEAESVRSSSPLLGEIDDFWSSSQSTLDVCVLIDPHVLLITSFISQDPMSDSEIHSFSLESYQATSEHTAFSDSCPRDQPFALVIDDENEEQVDDLARSPNQYPACDPESYSSRSVADRAQLNARRQPFVDGLNIPMFDSFASEPLSSPAMHGSLGSQSVSDYHEALSLDAPTSYLPLILDDDPAWDSDGESGTFCGTFTATGSSGRSMAVSVLGSPDKKSLSSLPRSEHGSPGFAETASAGNFLGASIIRSGERVRRTIDEEDRDAGAHEGNEGSLVAGDGCHALVIRSGDATCVNAEGYDAGAGEPELLEFDAAGDDNEMLVVD